jgi:hypothetical protein
VQAGIADARETLGANGQEHAKTGPARSDSSRSAEKTEHACFDEQLAHNAAARRADGETESDLLAAVGARARSRLVTLTQQINRRAEAPAKSAVSAGRRSRTASAYIPVSEKPLVLIASDRAREW